MTDFIIKRFVKNYENVSDTSVRLSYGKTAGITGIICNAVLFALKLAAGIIACSVSVTADAVNNLSDASSGVISLIGFRLSAKPADREHPYGHGRYEYLAGLVVALMIMVIGTELLRESISKIIAPQTVDFTMLTAVILVCSVAVKIWMMIFYGKIGGIIESKTLLAASADSRNDAVSTSAVLLGAVLARFFGIQLDGWIGAGVAVFIIVSGIGTVRDTLDPVLGRAPDSDTVDGIKERIMRYDGVLGTHDLMVHDYGPGRQFASVHVEMAAEGDAIAKHEIIDNIERDFLENDGIHMIVHYDPVPSSDSALGNLRCHIGAEIRKLDERITIHDLKMKNNTISLDCVVPDDMEIGEREIKRFVENIVKIKYPDSVCRVNIDHSFTEIAR